MERRSNQMGAAYETFFSNTVVYQSFSMLFETLPFFVVNLSKFCMILFISNLFCLKWGTNDNVLSKRMPRYGSVVSYFMVLLSILKIGDLFKNLGLLKFRTRHLSYEIFIVLFIAHLLIRLSVSLPFFQVRAMFCP